MSVAQKLASPISEADELLILKEEIKALHRVQAVIEFNLDGTILTANENFLSTLGYSLDEIVNNHHSMFCDPEYAKTLEYKKFWQALEQGEFVAGEFKRFGKNGKDLDQRFL